MEEREHEDSDAADASVKDEADERQEEPEGKVEEESDQSFPASDPPSY